MLRRFRRFMLGRVRYFKLRLFGASMSVGPGFYCGHGIHVSNKNEIEIGRNFYMGNYCHLAANAIIGDYVLFGSFVSLVGGDHRIDNIDTQIRDSGRDILKVITIRDNVWIGHGATLIHGITIESGAVIAAGAVVARNVPENAIYGGNPAELIRYREINDGEQASTL